MKEETQIWVGLVFGFGILAFIIIALPLTTELEYQNYKKICLSNGGKLIEKNDRLSLHWTYHCYGVDECLFIKCTTTELKP